MLKNSDLEQLKEKGISPESINKQIERFKNGFPTIKATRPATLNDGIIAFPTADINHYKSIYHGEVQKQLKPMKFVPASGAATRMFKDLFQFLDSDQNAEDLSADHPVRRFLVELPRFAFFSEVEKYTKNFNLNDTAERISHAKEIIHKILTREGLGYGFLPKGLIPFHRYPKDLHTPLAEHLYEAAAYAKDLNRIARVHFTISPEHYDFFKKQLENDRLKVENETQTKFEVTFSFQKPYTDTIAVTLNNEPFRDENGHLVFRPGGHGSLIENLNDCNADILFIKNIDNVVPTYSLDLIITYKQALAGLALKIRNNVFAFLNQLDTNVNNNLIDKVRKFIAENFHTDIPEPVKSQSVEAQAAYLHQFLNRPIRVCGMVKNVGDPGGGPFWVEDNNGQQSLQIVEGSQFDLNDPHQKKLFNNGTHFNPVDLVCIPKNYKGEKFDLTQYIDPETGFISQKSVYGKTIKALERPGLWNGAMAHWLTLFVEVPVETFNPVKTVNDLLKPVHQTKQ
jgi:hypothetical protein